MERQTYRWMLTHLADRPDADASPLKDFRPVAESETHCTKTGIVLTSLGGVTSGEVTARGARELALTRRRQMNRLIPARRARLVRARLAELLRYERAASSLVVRHGCLRRENTPLPLRIHTSNRLTLKAKLWRPKAAGRRPAVIHLAEKTEGYRLQSNPICRALHDAGATVLDLDPRGMGPLAERWLDSVPLGEADLTYDAFLLGRPLLGTRVADVSRGVDALLRLADVDPDRIGVIGEGYGAMLALMAACLDDRILRIAEIAPLTSWSSLAWHRSYDWPVNVFLPGVLEHFDLADVRAAVAPKPLAVLGPVDHQRRSLSAATRKKEFESVERTYAESDAFRTGPGSAARLPRWVIRMLTDWRL